MGIDLNALVKAAGITVAVHFIMVVMLSAGAVLLPIMVTYISVAVVGCCLIWLVYAASGVLYGIFTTKNGRTITGGSGALGGALSAGAASVVAQTLIGIASLIMVMSGSYVTIMTAVLDRVAEGFGYSGVDPALIEQMTTGMGPGNLLLSSVPSIFFGLIIAAILGAIGGAIYGSTRKDKGSAAG
jgi:hypothetical protein